MNVCRNIFMETGGGNYLAGGVKFEIDVMGLTKVVKPKIELLKVSIF